MYALKLPPELVRRLYHLREVHCLGPIRKQVLIAVEHYLDNMEEEYGESDGSPVPPTSPPHTAGNSRDRKGSIR